MKDLSKQVVSLKLAKRLKKAGYPQEGDWIAAPTTIELTEQLPDKIPTRKEDQERMNAGMLEIYRIGKDYFVNYLFVQSYRDKYLPDALAKMWMWLKNENLL